MIILILQCKITILLPKIIIIIPYSSSNVKTKKIQKLQRFKMEGK